MILGNLSKGEYDCEVNKERKVNVTKKMTDLTMEEIQDVATIVRNSDALHAINRLGSYMKHDKFNEIEQKFINEFIEKYNMLYNSSLAKAMSESTTNEEE